MSWCSWLQLALHLRWTGALELNLGLMLSQGLHLLLALNLCLRLDGGHFLDLTVGLNLDLGTDLSLMQRLRLRGNDCGDHGGDRQRLHVHLHRRARNLRHLLHGHHCGGVLDLH